MIAQYSIRPFEKKDYPALIEIENLSFVAPWKLENFASEIELNEFANIAVITVNELGIEKVVGYYDYWVTFDSATIAKIAVHPDYRRNGIASILMKEIIDDCYAKRVRNITLEVRIGNEKAVNLYKKFGFEVVVTKPHYYDDGEDAFYMIRKVDLNG